MQCAGWVVDWPNIATAAPTAVEFVRHRRSTLEPDGDRIFRARAPEPTRGWVAYFVELTFASGGPFPFKFTTEVRVAPETLPFSPPPEMMSAKQGAAEISD
jgi:PhoPQ-activated pathogenicity-related protein